MSDQSAFNHPSNARQTAASWDYLTADVKQQAAKLHRKTANIKQSLQTEDGGITVESLNEINRDVDEPHHVSIIPGMKTELAIHSPIDAKMESMRTNSPLWNADELYGEQSTHCAEQSPEVELTADSITVYPSVEQPECIILRFASHDEAKLREVRERHCKYMLSHESTDISNTLMYTGEESTDDPYEHINPHLTLLKTPDDEQNGFSDAQKRAFETIKQQWEDITLTFKPAFSRWD